MLLHLKSFYLIKKKTANKQQNRQVKQRFIENEMQLISYSNNRKENWICSICYHEEIFEHGVIKREREIEQLMNLF